MDRMFVENANIQNPQPHHDLFLRARPYMGERPTVAGFLIYPDTPAKMATTTQEAFGVKTIQQRGGKGAGTDPDSQQQPCRTAAEQTGRGGKGRDKEAEEDKRDGWCIQAEGSPDACGEMLSQYQKDYAPQATSCRRRTPALPQPDNIGINPAFRFEFRTVQRETYPSWSIAGRQRPDSTRDPQM